MEQLFRQLLELKLTAPETVATMRAKVRSGEFSADHYRGMWEPRLRQVLRHRAANAAENRVLAPLSVAVPPPQALVVSPGGSSNRSPGSSPSSPTSPRVVSTRTTSKSSSPMLPSTPAKNHGLDSGQHQQGEVSVIDLVSPSPSQPSPPQQAQQATPPPPPRMPPLPPTEALTRTQQKGIAARGRVRNPPDFSENTQVADHSPAAPPPISMSSSSPIRMSTEEDRHNENENEPAQHQYPQHSWIDLDSTTLSDGLPLLDRAWGSPDEQQRQPTAFSEATLGRHSGEVSNSTRFSSSLVSSDGSPAATPRPLPRPTSAAEEGFQALLAKTKNDLDDLKKRLQAAKLEHVPTPSPRVHRKFDPQASLG